METIKIGKIVGTHALKGEVKIRSHSDFVDTCLQIGKQIFLSYQKEMLPLEIVSKRMHKGNYLIAYKDHQDINLIEKYVGCFVYVQKEETMLAENEYYVTDIMGCQVYTTDAIYVGEIKEIKGNGRHDNLVIDGPFGNVAIPYVDAFVKEEAIESKKMIVQIIPGMLNEN